MINLIISIGLDLNLAIFLQLKDPITNINEPFLFVSTMFAFLALLIQIYFILETFRLLYDSNIY